MSSHPAPIRGAFHNLVPHSPGLRVHKHVAGALGFRGQPTHGPGPSVVRRRIGAQKVGQRRTVAAARCIESAKRRAAPRSEAETATCRPQLAVLGIQKVGRERRVSRVLFSPIQIRCSEYAVTSNDTQRHDAAGY